MVKTKIKDEDIKLRIREVIKNNGGNASKFAKEMNINPAYFASVLNSPDKGISATLFKSLYNQGVDINWLISGETKVLDEVNQKLIDAENQIDVLEDRLDFANKLSKELKSMIMNQN